MGGEMIPKSFVDEMIKRAEEKEEKLRKENTAMIKRAEEKEEKLRKENTAMIKRAEEKEEKLRKENTALKKENTALEKENTALEKDLASYQKICDVLSIRKRMDDTEKSEWVACGQTMASFDQFTRRQRWAIIVADILKYKPNETELLKLIRNNNLTQKQLEELLLTTIMGLWDELNALIHSYEDIGKSTVNFFSTDFRKYIAKNILKI